MSPRPEVGTAPASVDKTAAAPRTASPSAPAIRFQFSVSVNGTTGWIFTVTAACPCSGPTGESQLNWERHRDEGSRRDWSTAWPARASVAGAVCASAGATPQSSAPTVQQQTGGRRRHHRTPNVKGAACPFPLMVARRDAANRGDVIRRSPDVDVSHLEVPGVRVIRKP